MKIMILLSFILLLNFFLFSTIINIPDDQPTIQQGIDASVNGDTVLVQPGTYVENINFNGNNITVASLFLTTQDTIYISETVIDGNQNGSVVTFENEEDSSAEFIGFTVTNGYASDVWPQDSGGGIHCNNSNPSLENVTITGNSADNCGGGIICWSNSSPCLVNLTITDNSAIFGGGGIACGSNSSPSLENVTITGNSTAEYGGGINCAWYSSPSLVNVIISGNFASSGGGILCYANSSPSLSNVTITGNSTDWYGGGIYCMNNNNPSLVNCVLWNDSPQEIYFQLYGDPNTITTSYSDIQGGENGIVTNNCGTVYWLEGNIDEDPLFVGTGEHPYSLLEDSPCIDAGIPDTTGLNLLPWDIIGNLRIWDGDGNGTAIIDMGAYEYGAPPYVDVNDYQLSIVDFQLYNYPNPFNSFTIIKFTTIERSPATDGNTEKNTEIIIYNIKGQKVKEFLIISPSPGHTLSVTWDGTDDSGKRVGSGIYFYKLKVNGKTEAVKKCLLLK